MSDLKKRSTLQDTSKNIEMAPMDTSIVKPIKPIKKPVFRAEKVFLDIVGDRYYLGTDTSIELDYMSRQDFINNYQVNNFDIFKHVFSTHLTNPLEERIISLSVEEREELLKGLNTRIQQIKAQRGFNNSSLVAAQNRRLVDRINILKETINPILGTPQIDPTITKERLNIAPKLFKLMKNKDKATQLEMILRIAWMLVNPDKVDNIKLQNLETIIAAEKSVDIIKAIDKNARAPMKDGTKLTAENYFDRIRLKKVISAPNIKTAISIARDEIIEEPIEDILRGRLEQVLTVLQVHKFMDSDTYKQLLEQIRDNKLYDEKLGAINKDVLDKLSVSLDPIYKFYRAVYYPVYDVVVNAMKDNLNKYDFTVMMNTLGQAMKYVRSTKGKNGIYKLVGTNIDKLQILIENISSNSAYIENKQYIDLLPDFILKQFHYKVVKKGEVKQDVAKPHLKNIEFYTLDQLSIPQKSIEIRDDTDILPADKIILIERMKLFFISDAVYMIVKHKRDKTQDIFNLFTIDYNTAPIPQEFITPLKDKNVPINKIIKRQGQSINYTVLALAILILFKSRIQRNPTIEFDTGVITDGEL